MTGYRAPKRRTIDDRWRAREMYPYRSSESPAAIEQSVLQRYPTQPFATHGSVCADLLAGVLTLTPAARVLPRLWRNTIIRQTIEKHGYMVGSVLVYSMNERSTKRRIPKSDSEQRAAFRRNLFAAYPLAVASLDKESHGRAEPESEPTAEPHFIVPEPERQLPTCDKCGASATAYQLREGLCETCWEVEPVAVAVVEPTDSLRAHHQWSVKVRAEMISRGLSWSMRPTIDGIALIAAGCPPDAVRDACLMDYPEDLRDSLGVSAYDFAAFGIVDYLVKAAKARVDDRGSLRPVCLAMVGAAGTGKTTLASVLAEELETPRYDISMSGGTPMSAFYGIDRLNADVTRSDFERWARGGGIHLFDEMDCADPNLLKIVNKALANRDYTNPLTSERIELSPDAIAVAGMNTLGVGVQAEYSAAEQLDFSTIDRFRAGRVRVDIDESLESRIVDAQILAAS